MKPHEKKVIYNDVLIDESGKESSFREVLIERLKVESYFSSGEIRFVETSHASN
jgi:hypothetical protein